jgi:DNA repair protein RadC
VKTISVVSETVPLPKMLDTPENAVIVLSAYLKGQGFEQDREHFGFAGLDARHWLVGIVVMSSGSAVQAPVDPRQLWQRALALGASALILFHTHPSCILAASQDDIALTRRIWQGGNLLGLPVHDHIILAPTGDGGFCGVSLRALRPVIFSEHQPAASGWPAG